MVQLEEPLLSPQERVEKIHYVNGATQTIACQTKKSTKSVSSQMSGTMADRMDTARRKAGIQENKLVKERIKNFEIDIEHAKEINFALKKDIKTQFKAARDETERMLITKEALKDSHMALQCERQEDDVVPSAKIFDELSKTAQTYYNNKYPDLFKHQLKKSRGKWVCNYKFEDGKVCKEKFSKKVQAKACRKCHEALERLESRQKLLSLNFEEFSSEVQNLDQENMNNIEKAQE